MHLSEHELKAYLDKQLPAAEAGAGHLESCAMCQARLQALAGQSERVTRHFRVLAPSPLETLLPVRAARSRLGVQLDSQKEKFPMSHLLFSRKNRPFAAVGAVIVLLVGAFAFPGVRAAAVNFLGLFRVQQIEVVTFNPANLPDQLFQGNSADFEQMLSETVRFEEEGAPQEVSTAEEAAQVAGFPVRLPTGLEGEQLLSVQPGARVSFTVDLPRVRALLKEIGRADIQLPDNLDGAEVNIHLPTSVTAAYGDCSFSEAEMEGAVDSPPDLASRSCSVFVQMPGPTIDAPPGLDIAAIGQAYLQVFGMPAEEAAKFSQRVDWATTLVIPIPRYGTTYEDVDVDGVQGTLVLFGQGSRQPQYTLLWVKNGMVYALSGPGEPADALAVAGTLK